MKFVIFSKNVKGTLHGWSKSTLIFFLSSFPLDTLADDDTKVSVSLIEKLIVSIAAVLVAQVLIPIVRHYLNRRSIYKSYIAYLTKNIKSALIRFGKESSVNFAKRELTSLEHSDWLTPLEQAQIGVPEIFPIIHNKLHTIYRLFRHASARIRS